MYTYQISAKEINQISMNYNPFYNIENPQLMSYEYAWVSFAKHGTINNAVVPKEIGESWLRCRRNGLNMNAQLHAHKRLQTSARIAEKRSMAAEDMDGFIRENGRKLIEDTFKGMKEESAFYGILTDRNGIKLCGVNNYNDEYGKLKLIEKIEDFSENNVGTNCFSVVSGIEKPYSVVGAQHYLEMLQGYAGYAAPVFDGDAMVAMIGFYTLTERMDDYISSFAVAVERAIENSVNWNRIRKLAEDEREEKQLILDTMSDGVLYVSHDGTITHCNQKLYSVLGMKKDSLIGRDINSIITNPPISELKKYPFSEKYSRGDYKISLVNSRGNNQPCFFNKYRSDQGFYNTRNSIWVFTITSDIKKLAQKLSVGNTSHYTFDDIKSNSFAMSKVIELAKKAANFEVSTIIEGDSGTGKEMLAQAIHNGGVRKNGPFVAIDCGALPSSLLESELFGYEDGAYTGARKGGKIGKIELANKGVLFLDEITNMPYDMQAKLLRALQERKLSRIGGTDMVEFDVQIIAATNKDIIREIEAGKFRQDLFYRLNIIHIKLPTLTERENDIETFIDYFMAKYNQKGDMRLSEETRAALKKYDWPGNVRQLENVIERMTIISNSKLIGKECIPTEILRSIGGETEPPEEDKLNDADMSLEEISRRHVLKTVEKYGNNVKKAANVLGISRMTVYKYINSEKK